MSERKILFLLILIMASVSLLAGGVAGWVLYQAAIEQTRERLVETAQSQARLIEAVARFDSVHSTDFPAGAEAATLSQIVDAHQHYKGFGKTGEFTLARREGDQIVFLINHRHADLENPKPVPFNSELAEPMRLALKGSDGTIIGQDYRGEIVVAAYEPVNDLNFGIVAKIDLTEVRAPFVRAAVFAGSATLLLVVLGSVLFLRISNPLIVRLRKQKSEIEAILNTANEAIVTIDAEGIIERFNPAAETMFGYSAAEAVGQNVKILMPPPHRDEQDTYIANYLKSGEAKILGTTRELVGRHKNGEPVSFELSVSKIDHLQLFTGMMRDISQRKFLQNQLLTISTDEQRRIGQNLHDSIGQDVMALGITANTLVEVLKERSATQSGASEIEAHGESLELATRLTTGLKRTMAEVRALSKGLVPVDVDAEGLRSALEDLTFEMSQLHGISCTFECAKPVRISDNQMAMHLYHIAQEAVTNAIKHGQTHNIRVTLEADPQAITLKIQDDGIGIPDDAQSAQGIGLRIMQYRSDLIGGQLTFEGVEQSGTLVKCHLRNGTPHG